MVWGGLTLFWQHILKELAVLVSELARFLKMSWYFSERQTSISVGHYIVKTFSSLHRSSVSFDLVRFQYGKYLFFISEELFMLSSPFV